VGTAGGTLVLRNHVRIGGTVAADMIRLDNDATASRFFCRFVVLSHGGGAVGGPVVGGGALPGCRAFTPPLVDPTLLAPVAVVPGGTDVRVRPFSGTAPLPAASLRDVVVGRGALLQLVGGSYTARSIRIAPNGRLVCVDACRIGVLERIVLAPRAGGGFRRSGPGCARRARRRGVAGARRSTRRAPDATGRRGRRDGPSTRRPQRRRPGSRRRRAAPGRDGRRPGGARTARSAARCRGARRCGSSGRSAPRAPPACARGAGA